MPKEVTPDEYGSAVAEIRWSHDQYVQLAVLHTDAETFVAWCRDITESADKWKAAAEGDETKKLDTDRLPLADVLGASMGIFWTPTRSQINKVISDLRRARDGAYGKDE